MSAAADAPPPTPFTVIGGFLGAGKTTLLNHVLANADGLRCAVLVNDFGAIDVDAALIAAHDGETMTLSNGCVCCSLASGFVETMLKVTAERHRFDHVLVEASGVSEPARIMDFARLDPELEPGATVVVVDAETLATRLADPMTTELVDVQLRAADLVLFNKVDLVGDGVLAATLATVRERNARAGVVRVTRAAVPLSVVPGTPELSLVPGSAPRTHGIAADRFHTLSLTGPVPPSRAALDRFAASLDTTVIRAKGIVRLSDEPGWWSWQRVGGRSEVESVALADDAGRAPFAVVLIATRPIASAALALPDGVAGGVPVVDRSSGGAAG